MIPEGISNIFEDTTPMHPDECELDADERESREEWLEARRQLREESMD